MAQSYLEKLNNTKKKYPNFWGWKTDDSRSEKKEKMYGFDHRECWCLDQCFYVWLYERLCCYLDEASNIIDLTYYKIEYKNVKYTLLECIQKMIKGCEIYFEDSESEIVSVQEDIKSVCEIWALIIPYMWW